MKLNELAVKDKKIFEKFLGLSAHELSVYAFENICIWQGLFDIEWKVIRDCLCVFFKDKLGSFLYFPPLGRKVPPEAVDETLQILDSFNKNKSVSRIENIEEKDIPFYRALGYECQDKYPEYLCLRKNLTELKGDKFKAKRACYNYFIKHYKFEYLPFSPKFQKDCMELYDLWMGERARKNNDHIYLGMLKDSRICLESMFAAYPKLDFTGRVVKINKEIKAFTFGYRLNRDTFCILYEVAELAVKGLAQFIFREFCKELKGYTYINIMDDSGLDNLKQVKLSYHPARLIPAYIARRKNA